MTLLDQNETGNRVRFSVSDTGIGIPDNKLERLFQRFSQVDGSTSREYGGSGLGLAICKRLVEMMGGRIGVDTISGQGSTFWAILTLNAVARGRPGRVQPKSYVTSFASPRLLLVEDMEVNREIATAILQDMGYRIDAVDDGGDAFAAVQTTLYDLVLMDIQMPGMDGMTATKHIRSLPNRVARIPIVAMTANVFPGQIEQFLAAGMNGHIGKPFKREEAGTAIDKCLSEAQAADCAVGAEAARETADREAISTLAELLGVAKINELLGSLEEQLKVFVATDVASASPSDISVQAHRLVASAGMLGFSKISDQCQRFEQELSRFLLKICALMRCENACLVALAEISKRRRLGSDVCNSGRQIQWQINLQHYRYERLQSLAPAQRYRNGAAL